jgi:Fic family protein
MYTPPFTITSEIVNLIAEISAQIERYAIRLEQSDGLRLRKANRIKTIHSSLAIEGNTLSEDEVRDIVDGKTIVAPIKQIQEVKNAIKTYELYSELDAFSVKDLLRAHGVMMQAIIDDAGKFRRGGVGVFGEQGLVHLAPPADRVPILMDDLFEWLATSHDHLLIRSCVFHYEFEFIHPFSDGNGRTGRLWQSLILGRLHPIFEHLPVENMVYSNQQAYYDAIGEATKQASSTPFIEFMLGEILKTLKEHQGTPIVRDMMQDKVRDKVRGIFGINSEKIIALLMDHPNYNLDDLAASMQVTRRAIEKHVKLLREAGFIKHVGSNKTGHWEIIDIKD